MPSGLQTSQNLITSEVPESRNQEQDQQVAHEVLDRFPKLQQEQRCRH
jgi:hypothetical protein